MTIPDNSQEGGKVELLPCPFCGDTEPLLGEVRHGDRLLHGFIVECRVCSANVDRLESEYEAVEEWNRRPTPSQEGRSSLSVEVMRAVYEWAADREVSDWGEAALMKALATHDGDWPGCEGCNHQCDEPCMPHTVAEAHGAIDCRIAQLVHDGKLLAHDGYKPPDGWTAREPQRKRIPEEKA